MKNIKNRKKLVAKRKKIVCKLYSEIDREIKKYKLYQCDECDGWSTKCDLCTLN